MSTVSLRAACLLTAIALLAATACVDAAAESFGAGIEIREVRIPMPDGVALAADLYVPGDAPPDVRLPVLLEYLPYRKRESRGRNYALYSYFVARGYIVARVDIRGTGESAGHLVPYEYSDQELADGEAVIAWLAAQPFSSGRVAMFGISWGGFNAIQMAMRGPPALKTIIAIDATEDLYQEDVHFMDGILHVDSWEMSQDLDNARPGAPDYRIDDAYFRDRFDTEPWMMTYKRQQRDGPFWDRASLKGRYESVRIPAFFIGGWYDGYRDSIPRMLEKLRTPVKAIVGPWSHAWPNEPYPKPGIEWRHEAVRWLDHWLKDRDTGIVAEPQFAVFVREWHPPGPRLEEAPGHWRWEDGWPIARTQLRTLYAQPDHTLAAEAPSPAVHFLRYTPSIGMEGGGPVMWWGDVAHDQRPTDAYCLVYDSAPLTADIEILGLPRARLRVTADAPRANWIVRLSDVAPDGRVTLVTGAAMNGTHRISARSPQDIEPGQPFDLEVELHFTSWVFAPGHRIRIAVGNAQWPMLWPTPDAMTTSLALGAEGASITLPVIPPGPESAPQFLAPAEDPHLAEFVNLDAGTSSGYGEVSSVDRNPQTTEVVVRATNTGADRYPWGVERYEEAIEHRTSDTNPAATQMTGSHRMEVDLGERRLEWESRLEFTSDATAFHYRYVRRLLENGRLIRERSWRDDIPRDYQ